MAVFVRAQVDRMSGWVELRFPYDIEMVQMLKTYPGALWDTRRKLWKVPVDLWEIIKDQFKHEVTLTAERRAAIHDVFVQKLRPYQIQGAEFLVRNPGALLTFQMRVGKTPTSIAAACALLGAGQATKLVVTYPAQVANEWIRQLKRWANLDLKALESHDPLPMANITALSQLPFLALGCHYEILDKHVSKKQSEDDDACIGDIDQIIGNDPFILIADEVQMCKNRKTARTKALHALSAKPNCIARWGLSGTIMRNSPRDLWGIWEFLNPKSMGGYWTYAKRYCAAFVDDMGHWNDQGTSEPEELAARLRTISFRKLRSDPDVAPFIPKTDRKVFRCAAPAALMTQYEKMEKALATQIKKGLVDNEGGSANSREAVKHLTLMVSEAKIPAALARCKEHIKEGFKILVFGHFHETLQAFIKAIEEAELPHHVAAGWVTVDKRDKLIEGWKASTGGSVLILSTLASGVGIDLSDADVAMFLEYEWVPADFRQGEDRMVDVHQGKRKTPPVIEYFLVKNTIDEAMGAALIRKIRNNIQIVGADGEMSAVASTLRNSGVVDAGRLGLENTDRSTVQAAIQSAVAKWITGGSTEVKAAPISFDDWDDPESAADDANSMESSL